jgi:hypothetical protein
MDKASAPGAGDSRFESWAGHICVHVALQWVRISNKMSACVYFTMRSLSHRSASGWRAATRSFEQRWAYLSKRMERTVASTLWPSGLRRWTQVPLSSDAWVRTPQVSLFPSRVFATQLVLVAARRRCEFVNYVAWPIARQRMATEDWKLAHAL